MQRFNGTSVVVETNAALLAATITVYEAGTLTPASLFSDDGVTPLANPFTSSATTGQCSFYAADGLYDLTISKTGYTTYTVSGVQLRGNAADSLIIVIDGAGVPITTGVKGFLEVSFDAVITAVRLLADQAGSIVVDIWKDTYANFPPTDADSITAAAPPTIAAAQKAEDTTLTGWTTTLAAGDVLAFNVDSAATITRLTVSLTVQRTGG